MGPVRLPHLIHGVPCILTSPLEDLEVVLAPSEVWSLGVILYETSPQMAGGRVAHVYIYIYIHVWPYAYMYIYIYMCRWQSRAEISMFCLVVVGTISGLLMIVVNHDFLVQDRLVLKEVFSF